MFVVAESFLLANIVEKYGQHTVSTEMEVPGTPSKPVNS